MNTLMKYILTLLIVLVSNSSFAKMSREEVNRAYKEWNADKSPEMLAIENKILVSQKSCFDSLTRSTKLLLENYDVTLEGELILELIQKLNTFYTSDTFVTTNHNFPLVKREGIIYHCEKLSAIDKIGFPDNCNGRIFSNILSYLEYETSWLIYGMGSIIKSQRRPLSKAMPSLEIKNSIDICASTGSILLIEKGESLLRTLWVREQRRARQALD